MLFFHFEVVALNLCLQILIHVKGKQCLFAILKLRFDHSDGVWDPEKWHASLYPTSERSSPVEAFKKDYVDDRVPLKRRIPGKQLVSTDQRLSREQPP